MKYKKHFSSLKSILKKQINRDDVYRIIDKVFFSRVFQNKIYITIIIIFLIAAFSLQTFPHLSTWDTDSPSFYTAAKGTLKKINIYNQQEFQELADSQFGKSKVVYPYLYWPILAQLFVLLSVINYSDYFSLLLVINIILTFICLYLIYSHLELKKRTNNLLIVFLFLTVAVNIPLQTTLHHGQINLLVFAIVLLSLLLLKHRRLYFSSLLLCLAVYLKIYPALFLILFLLQKKYRYLVYCVINSVAICLLSVIIFSIEPWHEFIKMGINNLFYGARPEFFFDYNAQFANNSLNGLLSQLAIKYNLSRNYVMPILILILLACFFFFKSQIKQLLKSKDLNLNASIVLILSLIFSTISWNHHYVIMMFPLVYFFNKIISLRAYNILLPFLLLASQILYLPEGGGFPFNQVILISTILLLSLISIYSFKKQLKLKISEEISH